MPQVALHRLIKDGVAILKQNPDILDDIFQFYLCDPMSIDYGQSYIDGIKTWFLETKIPVVQAWSMSQSGVPQITVKLASEQEDISKAAIGDYWGEGENSEIGVGVFNVQLDVNLHGTKSTDEVLWLYYIVNYILFKRKRQAELLGLQLHTFSATDYTRDNISQSAENMYVRTIRYSATVQNFWDADSYLDFDNLEVDLQIESAND